MSDHDSDIVYPQGSRIRKARGAESLPVASARVGIPGDGSFLSRIERGVYLPNLETKLKLAVGFGLKLSNLAEPDEVELVREVTL